MSLSKRLDLVLVDKKLVPTRSQAESHIKLGAVKVNGKEIRKPGFPVKPSDKVTFESAGQYVSRAGMKLASVATALRLDFRGKIMLDVGSSTGGFTDYALQSGAAKVIAVDVGTNQLHHSLRTNPNVELHEQTDIRNIEKLGADPVYTVIDVSFISLREILPAISRLAPKTQIIAMVKPQFEAGSTAKHKGVIKNEKMRRDTLKDFESWARQSYKILDKADSQVAGEKGNKERFYLLSRL